MTVITAHTTRATGTILTAAIYNFDHQNHIGNATALRDGKIEKATPPVVDGTPVVFSGTGGDAVRSGTAADVAASLFFREPLTSARTYYVRADGNDTNTGLVDSAGGAFLTIQKAINVVYGTLDLRSNNVTIQVRTGTFARAVVPGPHVGIGTVTLQGDSVTPANVILTATAITEFAGVIDVSNGATLIVKDLSLNTVTSGSCIFAWRGGRIFFGNIRFGACANDHLLAVKEGYIEAISNYAIVGNAARHIYVGEESEIAVQALTLTLSGTPAFSSEFVFADALGAAVIGGNTYSGAATGKRFTAQRGGFIYTLGNLTELPGNAAGTVVSDGIYAEYGWNTVPKTAIETRSASAALANDGALQFAMVANTTYDIRMRVYYDTAAAPGLKYALSGPASPTLVRLARKHISAAALTALVVASEVAYTASTSLPGGTTGGYIEFDATVANGANAGTFAFQWAQDTSNASNTSVNAGSYLEYRKVAP